MYEEGVIKWEGILTVLIGIAIVAFISLLLYRRRLAKHKQIEREAELLRSNIELESKRDTTIDMNIPSNDSGGGSEY